LFTVWQDPHDRIFRKSTDEHLKRALAAVQRRERERQEAEERAARAALGHLDGNAAVGCAGLPFGTLSETGAGNQQSPQADTDGEGAVDDHELGQDLTGDDKAQRSNSSRLKLQLGTEEVSLQT
jgi:hypothetical protein